jgi:hypothetical protein
MDACDACQLRSNHCQGPGLDQKLRRTDRERSENKIEKGREMDPERERWKEGKRN